MATMTFCLSSLAAALMVDRPTDRPDSEAAQSSSSRRRRRRLLHRGRRHLSAISRAMKWRTG